MAYIGSTPTSQNFISGTDYFNGTGSQTAFTLTRSVNSVNDIEVVVNNVIQQPSGYTVSGTTLTLSAAPSSGTNNVYVRYLATNQQSFTVGNNTVGYNQLTTDMQSKFAMKNRIINGAMVIDQRNAGASVTPTSTGGLTYGLDRWGTFGAQSSKFSVQQNAGSVTPPVGFTNYLGITSLSAYTVGASEQFIIAQRVEGFNIADLGWGTASASHVTLSFWVRSSLTGTFGGALRNGANDRSYPFTYTISAANTWEQKSITVAGDTTGTWLTTNGTGLNLNFGLGVGSTLSGTAGAWAGADYRSATGATSVVGTNGATFYITGVQLEAGSSATGFEYRQYQQELALCQRYARGVPNGASQPTIAVGGNGLYSDVNTITCSMNGIDTLNMRTTPTTVTTVGTQGTDWAFQTSSGVNQTGFALTVGFGIMIGTKTSHGITNNVNLRVLTTSGNIIISAEL